MSGHLESAGTLTALAANWRSVWPQALEQWNRYVQLSEPRWCFTAEEEAREELTGSFAMIRLVDHAVVVSLRQIAERGLESFAMEILAHEIGHHIFCPADLTDNARLLARVRAGLPTKEHLAPFIANLYTDLMINDRLQRLARLNVSGVYLRLASQATDRMWTLYMRIYECLWSLPRAALARGKVDQHLDYDAQLGARLIRTYAKDWLEGAGRFAVLCLSYLLEDDATTMQGIMGPWLDTTAAGKGGLPDGVTEIEDAEGDGAIHPAEDERLTGVKVDKKEETEQGDEAVGKEMPAVGQTGHKTLKSYRGPVEYADVLRASGVNLSDHEITARYYRERALPHLVPFPSRPSPQHSDIQPEGLELWDVGSDIEDIDWVGTAMYGAQIIPGVTTRQRLYGSAPDDLPQYQPIDLYLGVDCSGSMPNPALSLSYPVLAGTIIALSALRTGSRVMAVLSGEPGKTVSTEGFIRDERAILRVLTGYLGTGNTFGIHRLNETFSPRTASDRPVHILIVTDNDIFNLLDAVVGGQSGWDVAREAAAKARGGATYVLQLSDYMRGLQPSFATREKRMQQDGWSVQHVNSMEELLDFASRFSQAAYGKRPAAPITHEAQSEG